MTQSQGKEREELIKALTEIGIDMNMDIIVNFILADRKRSKLEGMLMAADVANDYNSSTTHKYMLGDCILGKLNKLNKIRKNKFAIKNAGCDQ